MTGFWISVISSLAASGVIAIAVYVRRWTRVCVTIEDRKITLGARSDSPLGQGGEELHIQVPGQDLMAISGGVLGRKEGSRLDISVGPYARRLVLAGWGVSHSSANGRYQGCLTDSAVIGTIECRSENGEAPFALGKIALPNHVDADTTLILRLADASPFVSGDPDDETVNAFGIMKRAKLPYRRDARQFWPFANVWVNELLLPRYTRTVTLVAGPGSFAIAHIRVINRPWPAEYLRRMAHPTKPLSSQRGDLMAKRAGELIDLAEEPPATLALDGRRLAKAAMRRVTAAYCFPDGTNDRQTNLEEAADAFLQAADVEWQVDQLIACGHYASGFICLQQAGRGERMFGAVEMIVEKLRRTAADLNSGSANAAFVLDPIYIKLHQHIGWFYLKCARAADNLSDQKRWLNKADDKYVSEIVNRTLRLGCGASESALRFAQERLLILERAYRNMGLARDRGESLEGIRRSVDDLLRQLVGDNGTV